MDTIFADGVLNVGLARGMIRIELGSVSISEKDGKGNPAITNKCQVIVSPQVFLGLFGNMERMVQKLIEEGVIRPTTSEERRSGPSRKTSATFEGSDRRHENPDRRKRKLH